MFVCFVFYSLSLFFLPFPLLLVLSPFRYIFILIFFSLLSIFCYLFASLSGAGYFIIPNISFFFSKLSLWHVLTDDIKYFYSFFFFFPPLPFIFWTLLVLLLFSSFVSLFVFFFRRYLVAAMIILFHC